MARTKQTSRRDSGNNFSRATFSYSAKKKKKRKPRQRKRWLSAGENLYGMGHSGIMRTNTFSGISHRVWQPVIDVDEMGHDDLDDEVLLGSIRGNIVGIQYYRGTVNNNEMVALEREPHNKYDRNAIKVTNVDRIQVGHIKRELARPLSEIIDQNMARPEGVVPFGASNTYSMPIDITLWGKPENQQTVMNKLRLHGFSGYAPSYEGMPGKASTSAGGSGLGYALNKRTFLSPSEVKNELDKLFENLQEGDKTSTTEPAKAIGTEMYNHQKQALNWMIQREKGSHLPPFWEEKNGRFFNSVTIFTSNERPKSVRGGILADDMGLGKTLEMIALIVTNFKDGKPIAVRVPGQIRKSIQARALKKAQMLQQVKREPKSFKKLKLNFSTDDSSTVSSSFVHRPVAKTISTKQILGLTESNLPEDEESTDTESEGGSESDEDVPTGDSSYCMLKKEDPEFKPDIKENLSPKHGDRPRRQVKRPQRYIESSGSEDDEICDVETPKKKVKVKTSGNTDKEYKPKGKGKGIGKKESNVSTSVKTCTQNIEVINNNCVVTKENEISNTQNLVTVQKVENIVENVDSVQKEGSKVDNLQKTETVVDLTSPKASVGQSVTKETEPIKSTAEENIKEDAITSLLKSLDLIHLKDIFVKEQITIDILVEMGHNDLKDIGIEAFGNRHRIIKAAAQFIPGTDNKKLEETGSNITVEDSNTNSKQTDTVIPSLVTVMCVDDELPDPSEQKLPTMVLETDPLDDLEELGGHASSSEYGSGTGRTETTGPRTTLIISPLSVLNNWLDQLEDHIHENIHLDIYTYYGNNRTKDPKILAQQDIVLTTYSILTADAKGRVNPLQKVDWLRIVLDEGHTIRNPNSQQTKAICTLKAERKWILTGTPIQNSMKDLWSLVNFLQISPFTDKQWWNRAIERPLNDGNDNAIKRVQHLMGAIAMRRTKTMKVNGNPIVKLPERNVFIEHVQLSQEERSIYEAMQKEGKLIVSRYFNQGTLLHNYGDVLAILMRLRQMCCHPLLVAKAAAAVQETIGHLEPGQAIPDDLRQKLVGKLLLVLGSGSDEECAICLDGLKEPVITHCAHVFCKRCIEAVIHSEKPMPRCPLCRGTVDINKLLAPSPEELQQNNSQEEVNTDAWKSSAKVDALINALLKLRQKDASVKSLVVSQFTSLLSLLEIPLSQKGFNFVRLDGSLSLKQRHAVIEQFSNSSMGSPTIMLLSLTAGGVGINLIAASRVFLMDPAWNPATEEQCFDRCHRLGQTRDVTITKIMANTLKGIAEDIVGLSYQLNGCLAKIPKIQGDHGQFLYSTTEKLRAKGIALQKEIAKINSSMEEKDQKIKQSMEKQNKTRHELCTLKKENFSLKRKLDQMIEQDEADRELSLIDDSLLSTTSEPSTPCPSSQDGPSTQSPSSEDGPSTESTEKTT